MDLWEYVLKRKIKIELASDQTSCHDAYGGGYTPAGRSFTEGRDLLRKNPALFRKKVNESLVRQFKLIEKMVARGTHFWDYGNSFLKAVFDAGATAVSANGSDAGDGFIFPSYVEHIMGPLCFDYGYGPFRWVCLSGSEEDLRKTDQAAMECMDPRRSSMDRDNYEWIQNAEKNQLVVGTQARILYADAEGRIRIAMKFNELIRRGEIGPIMVGRDHHDVSGTDSPFRETADIKDGSNITADMAVHNFAGDAVRGMSMVVLSNGGGVGIGKAFNGGFGSGTRRNGTKRSDHPLGHGMGRGQRNRAPFMGAQRECHENGLEMESEKQGRRPYHHALPCRSADHRQGSQPLFQKANSNDRSGEFYKKARVNSGSAKLARWMPAL